MADTQLNEDFNNETDANVEALLSELMPAATERDRDASGKFVARRQDESDASSDPVEGDEADDAAPDDDQPSGEEDGDEPDDEGQPLIEPPNSWTKEQRDAWNALTPQAKQVVLERETARDAEVRRVQNEAAEERKAAKAERDQAAQERQQYAENLKAVHQLQAILDPVLAEGNQIDWAKLAKEDPAGYVAKSAEYQQRLGLFQAVQAEIQQVTQRQNAEAAAMYAKRLSEEYPDLADATKAKAVKDSWLPTLKHVGFTDQEIEQGWGIMHEPRYFKILDLAAKQIKAEAERAALPSKKVVPQPGKVTKPRAADTGAKGKPANIVALEKRAKQSGRMSDEADLILAQIMNGK